MTPPPDDSVQAVVAEFEAAVDRSARAMATALEDLLTEVKRAAEVVALRLRNAAVPVQSTEATQPTATPPVTVPEPKRTMARRLKLNTLWAVTPPLSRATIAAELNAIKPGADLTPNDVGVWASAMGLPRRDGVGQAPAVPLPTVVAPVAAPAPAARPGTPVSAVPAPVLESRPAPSRVPSGTAVQPVEVPAERKILAAAQMAPKPAVESPRLVAPSPAAKALAAAMIARSGPGADRPPPPTPAPKSNHPKFSGSSPVRPAAPPARPMPALPATPIVADETYIRRWAAQRAIPQGRQLDMAQINAKARSLGLRPFADPAENRPARAGAQT